MPAGALGCWIAAATGQMPLEAALNDSARVLGARSALLAVADTGGGEAFLTASSGTPECLGRLCREFAERPSPEGRGACAVDGLSGLLAWAPLQAEGGPPGSVGWFFAMFDGAVDRDGVDAVASLARRAIDAREGVSRLRRMAALGRVTLDQAQCGAAIADGNRMISEANDAFKAILGRGDAVQLARGALTCRRRGDEAALATAVHKAIHTPLVEAPPFRLHRTQSSTPYVCRVVSDPQAAAEGWCVITILSPDYEPHLNEEMWRAMFRLTDCELMVARGLVSGKRLHDIAEQRGVSVQTVRSQVKRLFERLDVRTQAQAALLLSRVAAWDGISRRGVGAAASGRQSPRR